jgi:DNA (cytosine-5)-methyltransferase 1
MSDFGFYEFFCGGGMARAGLGARWRCLVANDFDAAKGRAYADNWGAAALKVADVRELLPRDLPGRAELAWASFPCQDLSLAGPRGGLDAERSGAFWPFWRLIRSLRDEGRAPNIIALENVRGALTSRGGADFRALVETVAATGYRVGAVMLDAVAFVPQSRPRLFVVAVASDLALPAGIVGEGPAPTLHPDSLVSALKGLSARARDAWLWWQIAEPARRNADLGDLIEDQPAGVRWGSAGETQRLLDLMSPRQRRRLEDIRVEGRRAVGTLYRRMRPDEEGNRVQRAEARFDGLAGCLRTPAGGSSRQTLIVVESGKVRTRLLSPREAARLMGLPDSYRLPAGVTEAYHLLGDGVVAPVVSHLSAHLIEPILDARDRAQRRRA